MKRLRVNVEGRIYEVEVDVLDGANGASRTPGDVEGPRVPEAVLRPRAPHRMPEDSICRCPIAGRVVEVYAAAGQKVGRNEPVLLLEAMKMQIPVCPAVDGVIKTIHVEAGANVATGQTLFELV